MNTKRNKIKFMDKIGLVNNELNIKGVTEITK